MDERRGVFHWVSLPAIVGAMILSGAGALAAPGDLVAPNAEVRKLAGDFRFTEGPVADAEGNVYFSDIPNQRIHKWSLDGKVTVHRENSGGSNGLFFDKQGNLVACEGGARRVTKDDMKGNITVLADTYDGKKLNSPNDLWIDPKGGIYFTDPYYGRGQKLEQDGMHVYYLPPGGKELIRVCNDLKRPNGIIGTPDGKTLYIADPGDTKTWVYSIQPDGKLSNKKLFCESGSDGMTMDQKGNIYLTTDAVDVYDPSGKKIQAIKIPERPANVTFAGKDHRTLFITARTSVYAIKMSVQGASVKESAGNIFDKECFRRAAASADIAGYSLSKVQRWLHEVALKKIDPETGLYRADERWNYRDTAADCYPFLCWAAWAVDKEALDGPVRNVLHVEQKLCNQVDRIPVPWDFDKKARVESQPYDRLIFEASEYVKDGLIAIVEVTGKDEWFERMKAIEEDIWKHARIDTPYGKIPSTNIEVNGEQLQALARLYTMTGEKKFLQWAERLGDYYLKPGDFVPTRLRDHGCEIIGGLGLLLGVESEVNPDKAREYLPPIRNMLDEILARGLNPDGLMINTLAKEPGRHEGRLSDGWGYNYVGYLCHDMVVGKPVYRDRIVETFKTLSSKPQYTHYSWEGNHNIDGYADSLEGAIYLLNRIAVPEGLAWVDHEMANDVIRSKDPLDTAKLWGTMKLESNGVRTVIMHALMHTRGLIARPWRRDLKLGAYQSGDKLYIVMKAEKDWSGKLHFDIPRHRLYMGFKHDWPRMNTLPEWFTVEPEKGQYTVRNPAGGSAKRCGGKALADGLDLEVEAGKEVRLIVEAASRPN